MKRIIALFVAFGLICGMALGMAPSADAKTVIKNQDGNLYTVYAYSPCFSESVRQGTTRVNLALTMYYNSRTQQTEICAAVPAIGVSGESA